MGGNDSAKLAANIVAGTQTPLTVGLHAEADDGLCEETDTGVIWSTDSIRKKDSNCFDTITGDISSAATPGFIKGETVGGTNYKGILHDQATRTGCDPANGSAQRTVNIQNTDYALNNDTLSCFLISSSTTLGSLASPGYAGGAAFDPAIYLSPRFVYVPILKVKPSTGGSSNYSVVGFRPGFITDEQSTATQSGPFTGSADESNGVIMQQNDVNQVKIFFFHVGALPQDGEFPVIDYLGVGQPIVRLLD